MTREGSGWRGESAKMAVIASAGAPLPMPLDDYRAKRNFGKSPEPKGDDTLSQTRRARSKGARFFCVQKHLASSLHYDFRLEHNGVLLSWAVPKGPSLDPADKRLAMHVEDHPLEYGSFEGVIPEGYGAGVVMLWDEGTWTPEVDDVDAALAKGDLKLQLDGYKLKGSWVLVRTRGWGGGKGGRPSDPTRSWLLIKHRDDWSGPVDITTFAPKSVKSGGTFRDILLQEAPDVWRSNRPGSGPDGVDGLRKIAEKVIALEEETAPPAAAVDAASPADTTTAKSKAATAKPKAARKAARKKPAADRPTTPARRTRKDRP
jgi:bifunctional non-homologous end joining protein LigD